MSTPQVDWIAAAGRSFTLTPCTVATAVQFFDRSLTARRVQHRELQLAALVALVLASKMVGGAPSSRLTLVRSDTLSPSGRGDCSPATCTTTHYSIIYDGRDVAVAGVCAIACAFLRDTSLQTSAR